MVQIDTAHGEIVFFCNDPALKYVPYRVGLFEAIVLGIIQGLTEFLPISSTAHVRIVPALIGWEDPGASFTAVIQLGTLLAVLIYFRTDLARAFMGWCRSFRGGEYMRTADAKLGWAAFVGTIPIIVCGFVFRDWIRHDSRSLYLIAGALIGLAILLAIAEFVGKRIRQIEDAKIADGWVVGAFQALSLIPGSSRSGTTITGAMFMGFDRAAAARFSFILSTPAILASGLFELYSQRKEIAHIGTLPVIVSTIVSFIAGYAAIAFLINYLKTRTTLIFIVYRIALGVLLLVLLQQGVLSS